MTKKMKYERPFLRTIGEDIKQCGCATGTVAGGITSIGLAYCINGVKRQLYFPFNDN